jgi:hypothetical protein
MNEIHEADWEDFMTETDKVLFHRDERLHQIKTYWQGVWMLLTTDRGSYESAPRWIRYSAKAGCLLAMLLNRKIRDHRYHHGEDMGFFNYEKWYGGWDCDFVRFDPQELRYCLDRDGDSWM